MGRRWQAWADAAVLAAVAVLLRVPFTSGWLWAWDSVLYARAIGDFHLGAALSEQRPHPPGYVLYVYAARALSTLFADERAGLVAFSVIAGSLTVAVGYALARAIAGRRAGVVTAAVLLADPVLWQASAIAYPYAMLALLGGAVALAAWRAREGGLAGPLVASAVFGLALGFRQDLLLHVGPLVAWSVGRRGPRAAALSAATVLVASLTWLVPTAVAAGGVDRYLALVTGQAVSASWLDGVPPPADAIAQNARLAAVGLQWQLLWLWPLAAGGAVTLVRRRADVAAFFLVWTAPTALVLVALHTGEAGYTLALAVPLAALVGVLVDRALSLLSGRTALAFAGVVSVLVLLLGTTFTAGHGRFSAYAIRRHDEILATQVAYIRANYSPAATVILGGANYLHALWYLPEYTAVHVPPRREGGTARELARQLQGWRFAVIFDDTHPRLRGLARRAVLAGGVDLYVIRVGPRALAALEDDGQDDEIALD